MQVREAQGLQCESNVCFQRGQVQQSYTAAAGSQLQQQVRHYLTTACQGMGLPEGASEGAHRIVLGIVEVQADLMALAPHLCLSQVCCLLHGHPDQMLALHAAHCIGSSSSEKKSFLIQAC